MIRNFFFSMTAFSLLALGACGDDGKTSDTNVQETLGTTDSTTNGTTEPGTTEPGTTDATATEGTGTSITGDDPTTTSPATTVEPTTVEPETTTEPSTTTEEPGTTTEEPGTTTESTTTTTTDGTTTDDELMQCLENVNPGDPCGECACTECLEELQACEADAGCTAIRECAQEAGCGGIDCLGPCGDIIQMNGGPFGPSGMLAQQIGTCVDQQCQGQC
ncbi:hypothetical protein [Nannocystis punicea]|uniref:Uncharacterized protein n=1 Tax=Nannocystis punicea TaxID=2995304 RepID=A0ABY7H3Y4_9BACT|nr:hypothetical protein [Nannocystis poenicansa]WAS93907.1 hypothetical protein O0S08_47855 [Nannocystis poenicansa]